MNEKICWEIRTRQLDAKSLFYIVVLWEESETVFTFFKFLGGKARML